MVLGFRGFRGFRFQGFRGFRLQGFRGLRGVMAWLLSA